MDLRVSPSHLRNLHDGRRAAPCARSATATGAQLRTGEPRAADGGRSAVPPGMVLPAAAPGAAIPPEGGR
jgi:hypothetical protein